jgi:hypothetical protein
MNSPKITLTVTNGSLEGTEYRFEELAECIVGRADDCEIRLPQDRMHMNVSRHHCAFAIDPPAVWVRDLHSHNGTYLNGKNIAEVPQIHANDNDEPRRRGPRGRHRLSRRSGRAGRQRRRGRCAAVFPVSRGHPSRQSGRNDAASEHSALGHVRSRQSATE